MVLISLPTPTRGFDRARRRCALRDVATSRERGWFESSAGVHGDFSFRDEDINSARQLSRWLENDLFPYEGVLLTRALRLSLVLGYHLTLLDRATAR